MKRTRMYLLAGTTRLGRATAVIGALAACLALCSTANASTAIGKRAYRIVTQADSAVLHFSAGDMRSRVSSIQRQLGPCVQQLIATTASDQEVAFALGEEVGVQYLGSAGAPMFTALATMDARLAALGLGATTDSQLNAVSAAFDQLTTLNACADAKQWQRSGFAPAQEPAGTKFAAGLARLDLTVSPGKTINARLSAKQARTLRAKTHKAQKLYARRLKAITATVKPWLNGLAS